MTQDTKTEVTNLVERLKSGDFVKETMKGKEEGDQKEEKLEWSPENERKALNEIIKRSREKMKAEDQEFFDKLEDERNRTPEQLQNDERLKTIAQNKFQEARKAEIEKQEKFKNAPVKDLMIQYCKEIKINYYKCPTLYCEEILLSPELSHYRVTLESRKSPSQRINTTFKVPRGRLYCYECQKEYDELAIKNMNLVLKLYEKINALEKQIGDLKNG